QTGSFVSVPLRIAQLVELIENPRPMLRPNAYSSISHDNPHAVVGISYSAEHHGSARCELDGIPQKICDHPPQLHAIRPQPDWWLRYLNIELQLLLARHWRKLSSFIVKERRQRELALLQLNLPRIKPRHIQHVAHQLDQGRRAALQFSGHLRNLPLHGRIG